ncbi:MAG: hypothetical protein MJZ32_05000 [Bacteroidaceae bacterium]|nr:hypothetical protein [Bacteroidaceae bacterium]
MKKKITITLFFLFAIVSISFADTGYVYKGKVGKYPIVFTVWATAATASGDYYYVSQGANKKLQLAGENKGNNWWYFTETLHGDYNGTFLLMWDLTTRNGYKNVTGTYTNIYGDTYKVVLHCVKVIQNPYHI